MKTHDELSNITNKIITDMACTYSLTIGESKEVANTIIDYINGKTGETPLSVIFAGDSK